MAIDVQYSEDGRGLLYWCEGRVTLGDFVRADSVSRMDHERFLRCRYLLVDYTELESLRVTPSDVRVLAMNVLRAGQSKDFTEACVAVHATNPVVFGLSRMFALLAPTPLEISVRRSREAAVSFIEERMRSSGIETDVRAFLDLDRIVPVRPSQHDRSAPIQAA